MEFNGKSVLVILLVLTVFASGCIHAAENGEPDETSEEPDTTESTDQADNEENEEGDENLEPRTIVIQNDGLSFEPDRVEVKKNRNITFIFDRTSGTHSLRIPEVSAGTGTLTYEDNQSFTVSFDEEGEYEFICSIGSHAEQGMTGTIVVS